MKNYLIRLDGKIVEPLHTEKVVKGDIRTFRNPLTNEISQVGSGEILWERKGHRAISGFLLEYQKSRPHEEFPYCVTVTEKEGKPFKLYTMSFVKAWSGQILYSFDYENWTEWNGTSAIICNGNRLHLRGRNNSSLNPSDSYGAIWQFIGLSGTSSDPQVSIKMKGNLESLLDWETVRNGNHPTPTRYTYSQLFSFCKGLEDCSELFIGNLEIPEDGCNRMFDNNTGLKYPPVLSATIWNRRSLWKMFYNCTSLEYGMSFPKEVTIKDGYEVVEQMYTLTPLTSVPNLPEKVISIPSSSTQEVKEIFFRYAAYCHSLVFAPLLPKQMIVHHYNGSNVNMCAKTFESMFEGSEAIIQMPALHKYTLYNIDTEETNASYLDSQFYYMFKNSGVKFSTTSSAAFTHEFKMPVNGESETTFIDWASVGNSITKGTKTGSYTGNIDLNTTYYTNAETVDWS